MTRGIENNSTFFLQFHGKLIKQKCKLQFVVFYYSCSCSELLVHLHHEMILVLPDETLVNPMKSKTRSSGSNCCKCGLCNSVNANKLIEIDIADQGFFCMLQVWIIDYRKEAS